MGNCRFSTDSILSCSDGIKDENSEIIMLNKDLFTSALNIWMLRKILNVSLGCLFTCRASLLQFHKAKKLSLCYKLAYKTNAIKVFCAAAANEDMHHNCGENELW